MGQKHQFRKMKFSIFLAGLLTTAVMAFSGINDPTEDLLPTAVPALTEGTVCPGSYNQGKTTSLGKSRYCMAKFAPFQQSWEKLEPIKNIDTQFVHSTSVVVGCRRVA